MLLMHIFRLWAPTAKQVSVRIASERFRLRSGENGWWFSDPLAVQANSDYAFVLDDGEPLPDPRSNWQPEGVHGRSRLLDHCSFPWSDKHWQAAPLSAALIYELHIGTFSPAGTFAGAVDKLDHLVELGVTHVELMPVAEFSGKWGWGYDGALIYAPHHAYGAPDDLKRFIDSCHARGLAVILDVVYNHLGPAGNYLARFGPYFTDRYRTPWGEAVNFDGPGSDEVRRFFCDNTLMWLRDYHFDALRLDAVHAMIDTSAVHFLEQLAREVADLEAQLGRHLCLIAESDLNDPRVIRHRDIGGYGIAAQWSDDFHHALHTVLTGERAGYYADFGSLEQLAKALTCGLVYDGRHSAFRQRRHGRPLTGISGHSLLGYAQNHDQIGNRATGERLCHLISAGRAKIAAALVLTAPFVPMLFQGEEWGASSPFLYFTDHQDPELGKAVTEGRRAEFAAFDWQPDQVPDPQDPETFERSKLKWAERLNEPHAALLQWYRRLIDLRRVQPALRDGRLQDVEVQFDERFRWLWVKRSSVITACNLGENSQRVPASARAGATIMLASEQNVQIENGAIILPPNSVAIFTNPSE
jgi:maltooligosyltrehalose trehalohydrolase